MQGAYGGLIIVVVYATSAVIEQEFNLITQDDIPILTEDNLNILVTVEE